MNDSQVIRYREPTWKIISNQINPTDHSSDNGLLFSATYVVQCDAASSDFFVKFVNACQVQPGLFNRYPGITSAEGWDDLVGVAAASAYLGLDYHRDILAWGESHNWTWNNQPPYSETPDSFLGRYPTFIPFIQMACNQMPTPADIALFIAGNEASALTPVGNESGKCLQYLMNKTVFGKHKEIDLSIWLWRQTMSKKYSGMKDVYSHYFGAQHPFALYGPTDFG